MVEFRMPSLGTDMKKGTLVEWKVKPGDHVKRGDIIAEVETEKGVIEIEVFVDGIIEKLLIQPGDEVLVGTPIALIRTEGQQETEIKAAAAEQDEGAQVKEGTESPLQYKACSIAAHRAKEQPEQTREKLRAEAGGEKRIKVSPAARKRAEELGLDLTTVRGTGPDGAISLADVEKAAIAGKPAERKAAWQIPTGPEGADFQLGMRRAIAAAMGRSNREIPHYYLETRIDLSRAVRWLTEENKKRSVKDRILPVVLLLKATALALTEVPALNGYWIEDRHQPVEAIHVGFAIALRQGGLIAPAIHHADLKSLDELMVDMKDLITRTRSGGLRSSEMTDATVTLTNLGDLGVESAFGLIYPPQVALVSFGRITDQPWVENGMIGIRPVVSATLAGDHRATDGRTGSQFLNALHRYLQEAERL
ncbi:putative dihydrolipoamide acetyltransferase, component E2 of pyruvate dehydrogenase [uncultured Desulfobacterium sp.]|uniref:Dihydrolipoamide acetyltransferase component of pyruvate dehydrogenase complex n=1 Tax=uncultured Desulfobacterium sp. TaxID=201089 RepID=A0A445MSP0_9BACT|nr:putative dihydrolipoamide acetyltransferase, component E2 of pyruvate dehydrogenase [uncultured Desulfobacterium sp.]